MEIGLIIAGIGAGFLSTFFGVGGGMIVVPSLFLLYPNLPHQVILSSSLGMIFLNSINNTHKNYKSGKVSKVWKMIINMGAFAICGAIISANLTNNLDPKWIKGVFAFILLFTAVRNLLSEQKGQSNSSIDFKSLNKYFSTKVSLIGFTGGIITGLTGLGGGVGLIPLLVLVFQIPFHFIPVITNGVMIFGSLSGLVSYFSFEVTNSFIAPNPFQEFQFGYVNFGISLVLFFGATIGAWVGRKTAYLVNPKIGRLLLTCMILFFSARLFYSLI